MKTFINKLKNFLQGWEKHGEHQRPKTFWKYFIYYPLNWFWTLGSLLFIGIFIEGAKRYESPLLWTTILIPLIMLVYNFMDEYYAFQWYNTGIRKVSAKTLINIVKYLITAVILYLIVRVFITG